VRWRQKNTDAIAVAEVLAGRREAFTVLVERYLPQVHAVALARLGNVADAEDVVQETFLKAYQSLDRLRRADRFRPWVTGIARNASAAFVRDKTRRRAREDKADPPASAQTDVERRETHEVLRRLVHDLDETHREVLLLYYFAGLKLREIAHAVGVSRHAVAKRLERARKALGARVLDELGVALGPHKADKKRAARLSAVVVAAPVPWKPGAAAVAAGGLVSAKGIGIAALTLLVGAAAVWTHRAHRRDEAPSDAASPASGTGDANVAVVDLPAPGIADAESSALPQEDGDAAVLPGATDKAGAALTARVYEEETGKGIPGARIHVVGGRGEGRYYETGETDEAGRCRFPGLTEAKYRVELHYIEAYARRESGRTVTVFIDSHSGPVVVDFPLRRGLSVTGVVVDSGGRPVEGARVSGDMPSVSAFALTASDGTFQLLGFSEGDEIEIRSWTDQRDGSEWRRLRSYRYVPPRLEQEGLRGLRLVLFESARIKGRVVNAVGRPVPEAYVAVKSERPAGASDVPHRTEQEGEVAGEDGSFEMERLLPGLYRFFVQQRRLEETVELPEGEQAEGVSVVYHGAPPEPESPRGSLTIAGRVLGPDGAPVQHAEVGADRRDKKFSTSYDGFARTREDGTFTIPGLSEGDYYLCARHRSCRSHEQTCVAAGTSGLVLRLSSLGVVEGRVLQADGQTPVVDFRVGTYPAAAVSRTTRLRSARDLTGELLRVMSAANTMETIHAPGGRFRLEGIGATEVHVVATAPGYGPQMTTTEVPGAEQGAASVVLRLPPEARFEGTVQNASGDAIVGALILPYALRPVSDETERLKASALARTDAQGRFVIGGLAGVSMDFTAYKAGLPSATTTIDLKAGATVRADFVLETGGRLEGRVTLVGRPVEGESVLVHQFGKYLQSRSGRTSSEGTFAFDGLISGEFDVRASLKVTDAPSTLGPDLRSITKRAVVAQDRTTVVNFDFVAATAALEGAVALEGVVPDRVKARLTTTTAHGDEEPRFLRVDQETGLFRCEGLPPGETVAQFTATRGEVYGAAEFVFTLDNGHTHVFDVDFSGGPLVDGCVSGLQAHELGGVYLFDSEATSAEELEGMLGDFKALERRATVAAKIGEDGSFRLRGLGPGQYTALAFAPNAGAADPVSQPDLTRWTRATFDVTEDTQTYRLKLAFDARAE